MAETKRSQYEIERDREEIAALLARNRRMSHQRIADILNRRRVEEYENALRSVLDGLGPNDPIPNVPLPYTLTRQMIDYDVKVLERDFRRRATEKYDTMKGYLIHHWEELFRTAWIDYEKSKRPLDETQETETNIALRTTEEFDADNPELTRRIVVPARKIQQKKKRAQGYGDPRFLKVIGETLRDLAEVTGVVDKEVNLNLAPTDVKLVAGFNPADWDKPTPEPTAADSVQEDNPEAG
ncbi:MAG: hypothetical protein V7638_3836 [Acidobacteriota bacterium]|jgi:hypothetical protein